MESYLYKEMFALEQNHWWFAAKHRIVLELLGRHFAGQAGRWRVADIGCGCGRMLELLAKDYDAMGLDASPLAVEFSHQRGVNILQGFLPDQIPLPEKSFDAVLMLDVLEHLDDDVRCAAAVAKLLKPGGLFLCTVPAYQWLYGPHDAAHHHRRRYRKSQLRHTLATAGLKVRYISYFNTVLFPLAVAQRLAQRMGKSQTVSTAPPARPINAIFQAIFASERHLLGRVSSPFGLSVLAMAIAD